MSFIAAVELVLDDAEVVGWSTRRSVPLGRYWRSSPLVFLFVPRIWRVAGLAANAPCSNPVTRS